MRANHIFSHLDMTSFAGPFGFICFVFYVVLFIVTSLLCNYKVTIPKEEYPIDGYVGPGDRHGQVKHLFGAKFATASKVHGLIAELQL